MNLHPDGFNVGSGTHVSLYLVFDGKSESGPRTEGGKKFDSPQVSVKYSLTIINRVDELLNVTWGPLSCTMMVGSPRGCE